MIYKIDLRMFDGEGATPAATTAEGETQAATAPTHRGKSGAFDNVVYGKQAESVVAEQAKTVETKVETKTPEERVKDFKAMINGDYKDIYTKEIQKVINQRFKDTKNLETQIADAKPILDMLSQKYGTADSKALLKAIEGDKSLWREKAEEEGLTDDQYAEVQRLRRENATFAENEQKRLDNERVSAQINAWNEESKAIKEIYPDFDFEAECENKDFLALLKAKVPLMHAYRTVHMDDIVSGAVKTAATEAEKRVVDSVRAKGMRPKENGTAHRSAFIVKSDVSKLTKQDRAEIAKRVVRGEKIEF